MKSNDIKIRFWEIDFLRGMAVVFMIVYHIFFDLGYMQILPAVSANLPITIIGRLAYIVFLLVCGISLSLSASRDAAIGKEITFMKFFKRGIFIFSLGLLITIVTRIFVGDGYIIFGVLHLIGVSVIISYPFLKLTRTNVILGILILMLGFIMSFFYIFYPWFVWLGLKPVGFYTLDYFPIFPYFGLVLLGIACGNYLYKSYQRKYYLPDTADSHFVKSFEFLGRHSLFIYLAHQPIIILAIQVLFVHD